MGHYQKGRGLKRGVPKRELYARPILLSRCNDASRPYEVGARRAVPFLDCPIKSGNDNWYEVSFRGRTGVLGVSPNSSNIPQAWGIQGVG